ncbi:MAG: hypothetical protein C4527_23120 [Candidatus Omnitrophota bacterium]|nr:MAG: hypothetical protein C4527_23120 [Candidatus Omnitrophota bacterium]
MRSIKVCGGLRHCFEPTIQYWHEYLGHPTLADAILDWLVHDAYKITLKREFMRKKKSKLRTSGDETSQK